MRSDSRAGPLTRRYAPTSPRKRGEVNAPAVNRFRPKLRQSRLISCASRMGVHISLAGAKLAAKISKRPNGLPGAE
jgi:hypothetical protein